MRQRSLFIVLGLLLVLLLINALHLPVANRIKEGISEGFLPFVELTNKAQGSYEVLLDRIKGYRQLQVENTELKRQISELQTSVAQVSELERENRDFRVMLDFKNRSEIKLISAKVIARDPSNWWSAILVDRGSDDGITKDMPILTVDGLVGKIIEVTKSDARVLLMVDENFKVFGWMKESGLYGTIQGNILARDHGTACRMMYVDRNATVKENDKVFTTGLGGIFPKGILIGTVSSVNRQQDISKSVLYQEVFLTPAVDLARIDEVFIGIGTKPVERPARPTPPPAEKPKVPEIPKSAATFRP